MKETTQVAAFILKANPNGEPSVLLGPKLTGLVAGHIMPPGGHIEDSDGGAVETCQREVKAETGLTIGEGVKVAELHIRIEGKQKHVIVFIFMFYVYNGELKPDGVEFEELKFYPLSEIPWKELVPGDEEWMREVLIDGGRKLVTINCGEDRNDVKSVEMGALPEKQNGHGIRIGQSKAR